MTLGHAITDRVIARRAEARPPNSTAAIPAIGGRRFLGLRWRQLVQKFSRLYVVRVGLKHSGQEPVRFNEARLLDQNARDRDDAG